MKHSIFVDTNVFLDYFLQREPGFNDATQMLILAEGFQLQIHTSSSNIVNVIYFLKKAAISQSDIIDSITDLLTVVKMVSPTEKSLLTALAGGFRDIEDAIQYHTALQIDRIDYFVTGNIRDFKKALPILPVVSPGKLISLLTSA